MEARTPMINADQTQFIPATDLSWSVMPAKRTHTCGDLRASDTGDEVVLHGWVHRRRDHGGLIFIDLRDRYGLTQVTFDPNRNPDGHSSAEGLRNEYVICVQGT
ncbi:MAG: hypothetical protein EBV45_10245, partial [Chloroflexi bacterium]|nr:hypothetical protein [Chloroflexota bacterium]